MISADDKCAVSLHLLDSVASTNTYTLAHAAGLPHGAVVYTHCQTSGRGQKGNSWEAEPGKNLTFSLLLKRPRLAVQRQFHISEAVSLAIVETLDPLTGQGLAIKWPNDIYWRDKKLGGMLIENSLAEGPAIDYCVIGLGLNVNQAVFRSDAPNPVSLLGITGRECELEPLLLKITDAIERRCRFDGSEEQLDKLHAQYLKRLFRHDGKLHPFLVDGKQVMAAIHDVHTDGHLALLHDGEAQPRLYNLKQVAFVI